jgi:hypothetical protein
MRNGTSRILRIGSAAMLRTARQLESAEHATPRHEAPRNEPGGPPEHWAALVREKAPWLLQRTGTTSLTDLPETRAFRGRSRRSSAPGGIGASRRVENREDPGAGTTDVPRRAPIGAPQPPPSTPIRQTRGTDRPTGSSARAGGWAARLGIRRATDETRSRGEAGRRRERRSVVGDGEARDPEPGRRLRAAAAEPQPPVDRAELARWVPPTIEPLVPPWDLEPPPSPSAHELRGAEGSLSPWPAISPDPATPSADAAGPVPFGEWDQPRPAVEHAPFPPPAIPRSRTAVEPDPDHEEPHPWPDLPAEVLEEVDAAASIREWERRRRLELEQRSL